MCLRSKLFSAIALLLCGQLGLLSSIAYAQSAGDPFHSQGRLDSSVIESLDTTQSETRYLLTTDQLTSVPLGYTTLPQGINLGAFVELDGEWEELPILGLVVRPTRIQQLSPPLAADGNTVLGSRSAVVIKVNFNNATVYCSESYLSDLMWNGTLNVRAFYETTTYNLLTFPNDVDSNSSPDVYTVSISYPISPCVQSTWMSAANTALTNLGVNLNQYQHRIYVLPEEAATSCGFAGQAVIGCSSSCWMISTYCTLQDVIIHELGHNLGMNHAGIDANNDGLVDSSNYGPYGDFSCPMGISGVGWRHFNAPHKKEMGWIPPERIAAVTSSADYYLASDDIDPTSISPTPPAQTQILTYSVPDQSGQTYYFSFRRSDSSYSQDLGATYTGKTNVHRFAGSGYTLFVRGVGTGEVADLGAGVQITQLQSGQNWAQVHISIPATPTAGPSPTNTPSPTVTPTPTPTVSVTASPTPNPEPSVPAEATGTPGASPTATARPASNKRYHFRGAVKLPKAQRSLFPKLRVRIDGPAGQRKFVDVSYLGKFVVDLLAGEYQMKVQAKPRVKIPRSISFQSQTVSVPEDLNLSLRLGK